MCNGSTVFWQVAPAVPGAHVGSDEYVYVSKPRIQPPSGSVCAATGAGASAGPSDKLSTATLQLLPVPHRTSTALVPAFSDVVVVTVDHGWAVSVGAAVSVVTRCPLTTRAIVRGWAAASLVTLE